MFSKSDMSRRPAIVKRLWSLALLRSYEDSMLLICEDSVLLSCEGLALSSCIKLWRLWSLAFRLQWALVWSLTELQTCVCTWINCRCVHIIGLVEGICGSIENVSAHGYFIEGMSIARRWMLDHCYKMLNLKNEILKFKT